jgi:cytochrome c oxidase subunit II
MGFEIVAEPRERFERWRAAQLRPAPSADTKGDVIFRQRGCALCHTIRGTLAGGRVGPDLTHVASRRTLAAASLPLNLGNLAAWIADPQHFKPGNMMPSMPLTGDDLVTLTRYLSEQI